MTLISAADNAWSFAHDHATNAQVCLTKSKHTLVPITGDTCKLQGDDALNDILIHFSTRALSS